MMSRSSGSRRADTATTPVVVNFNGVTNQVEQCLADASRIAADEGQGSGCARSFAQGDALVPGSDLEQPDGIGTTLAGEKGTRSMDSRPDSTFEKSSTSFSTVSSDSAEDSDCRAYPSCTSSSVVEQQVEHADHAEIGVRPRGSSSQGKADFAVVAASAAFMARVSSFCWRRSSVTSRPDAEISRWVCEKTALHWIIAESPSLRDTWFSKETMFAVKRAACRIGGAFAVVWMDELVEVMPDDAGGWSPEQTFARAVQQGRRDLSSIAAWTSSDVAKMFSMTDSVLAGVALRFDAPR